MQVAVSDAELERLEERLVLHEVERVEHVEAGVLRRDEGVVHQLVPRRDGGHVVERVRRLQRLVHWVMHHRRRQRVVAHHVRDDAVVLDDVSVDDAGARQEPVPEIFLVELRSQMELCQIL